VMLRSESCLIGSDASLKAHFPVRMVVAAT
jgi:hypothetical protein